MKTQTQTSTALRIAFTLGFTFITGVTLATGIGCNKKNTANTAKSHPTYGNPELKKYPHIVLGGGCFWCTQSALKKLPGVQATFSGFAYEKNSADSQATPTPAPDYESVATGAFKAREAVIVYYDPKEVYLDKILDVYWRHIDPTDTGGQFADRGYQYTTAIYFANAKQEAVIRKSKAQIASLPELQEKKTTNTIVSTEILPLEGYRFALAEEYHQDYDEKNPSHYQNYFRGSGRKGFIESFWDKIRPEKTLPNSSLHEDAQQKQEEGNMNDAKKEKNIWAASHFSDDMKNERVADLDELSKYVTQHDGTERPYENKYWDNKEEGIYVDIVSGEPLFLSKDKYDSKTGWPSFTKPIDKSSITSQVDYKLGMPRTEVRSQMGNSHLGHIFPDGPSEAGGMRYCINSAALQFIKKEDMQTKGYGEYVHLLE